MKNIELRDNLSKNGNINFEYNKDVNGWSSLCLACYSKNFKRVKKLVDNMPKNENIELINKPNMFGESPIYLACRNNDLGCLEYLLKNGATLSKYNEANRPNCLYIACENENLDIIDILLKNGAKIDINSFCIACRGGNLKFIDYLFEKNINININSCNIYGKTPLCIACEKKNLKLVKKLINMGAYVNIDGKCGRTPLGLACEKNDFDIVKLLLEFGAKLSINFVNKITKSYELTAFCLAFNSKNFKIMDYLIEAGIDVNFEFYYACKNGCLMFLKYLVEKMGADINTVFLDGWTPINMAINNNDLKIVSYLFKNGAKIDEKSFELLEERDFIREVVFSGVDL
jgi:ankyrin repeat protein